ncbi:MAG: radical SAM protein [Candidatus Diapherotrites archaeon]|nr:radical SAM protein [Candidatus Diapherotrites archaeon]
MLVGLERYEAILEGKAEPNYLLAKKSRLLSKKIKEAEYSLQSCELCERKCRANRAKEELGYCGCDTKAKIFGAFAHYGEEPELVPSATLFFSGCTMHCVYCQNAPDSVTPSMGELWNERKIATWIESMHNSGCKNVNFVGGDPTPYVYNILKALSYCKAKTPVVWNSNAYYSKKTADLLKGIVDVYLLDFRYFNDECALKYSKAPNYVEAAKRNFLDAYNDAEVLVRLLVMPSHIECCAKPILDWLAKNLSKDVRINILNQYWPAYKAHNYNEINRRLDHKEICEVLNYAKKIGLKNLAP